MSWAGFPSFSRRSFHQEKPAIAGPRPAKRSSRADELPRGRFSHLLSSRYAHSRAPRGRRRAPRLAGRGGAAGGQGLQTGRPVPRRGPHRLAVAGDLPRLLFVLQRVVGVGHRGPGGAPAPLHGRAYRLRLDGGRLPHVARGGAGLRLRRHALRRSGGRELRSLRSVGRRPGSRLRRGARDPRPPDRRRDGLARRRRGRRRRPACARGHDGGLPWRP